MMKRWKCFAAFGLCALAALRADVHDCHCDLNNPVQMATERDCALCAEAERQPAYLKVFFLKDANPTKPNRVLALPRKHAPGSHALASLSAEVRLELWTAAIARAHEIWGEDWGIACNAAERRTQCHTHLHIGKVLPDQENGTFVLVDGPADIPAPSDGGIWVHPAGAKLHVHLEPAPELHLMR